MYESKNSDKAGLVVAITLFTLIAAGQLIRAFMAVPIDAGGILIPVWVSFAIGAIALLMAFWMGSVYNHISTAG